MDHVVLGQIESWRKDFPHCYEAENFLLSGISSVLCNNPSHMTLQGTNTWIIRTDWIMHSEQSSSGIDATNITHQLKQALTIVVIDPGPLDEIHGRVLTDIVQAHSARVLVLLTHSHADHCGGALEFAKHTGAIINSGSFISMAQMYESDPAYNSDDAHYFHKILTPGDFLDTSAGRLYCISTPGHTDDSVSYFLDSTKIFSSEITSQTNNLEYKVLFSGDTILGAGSTVLLSEDGLKKYYESLQKIIELGTEVILAPGHGNIGLSAQVRAQEMLDYRMQKLNELQRFLGEANIAIHEAVPTQLVQVLYKNTVPELWFAAELSLSAQIEYLRKHT